MSGADSERAQLARAAAVLDRRAFLRLAGGVAAAGLLPAGCGGVAPELTPPPDATLRVLSLRQHAVFTAAAGRLLGPRAEALIADGTVPAGMAADATLADAPELAGPLGPALWLLELGVWPLLPKLRPFTALAPEARDAVLRDLSTSRLATKRALYRGLKSLACLAFYAHPASRAVSGYPGPFGERGHYVREAMRYDVET